MTRYHAAMILIVASGLTVSSYCFLKGVQHARNWKPEPKAV